MKEAVWFKNGKEISWVDPVEEVVYDENITKITEKRKLRKKS